MEPAKAQRWAKGNLVKKAAVVLAVAFLVLCLLTFVGCGNGTWANTGGAVSKFGAGPLVYDSTHNILYAGCVQQVGQTVETAKGVWKYDGTTWTNTGGGVSSYAVSSLVYDSSHNLLYAGADYALGNGGGGVWKYDGTTWANIGGGVFSYEVKAFAYDSVHNVLYAGTENGGVWKY